MSTIKTALKTPPEIQDPQELYLEWEKGDALSSLNKAMDRLKKNMHKKTAAELRSKGFEHPFFGPLSLLDWIWAMTLHEKGHMKALAQKQ